MVVGRLDQMQQAVVMCLLMVKADTVLVMDGYPMSDLQIRLMVVRLLVAVQQFLPMPRQLVVLVTL